MSGTKETLVTGSLCARSERWQSPKSMPQILTWGGSRTIRLGFGFGFGFGLGLGLGSGLGSGLGLEIGLGLGLAP